jgi:hypothetical protein
MLTKSKVFAQTVCAMLLILGSQLVSAAPGGGSVMGRVTDPDTKAPAADVTVVFECQGSQKAFITNDSGYYYTSNLPVGVYIVTASYMSTHAIVKNVIIGDDDQKVVDIKLSAAVQGKDVVIDGNPLIDPIGGDKKTLRREDFINTPITKIADITATQPGVTDINGVFYVKGAREGSLTYYIDGSPAMIADIPLCGLGTYTIYTGFVPVKYGNTVGGVVVMETRNFFSENHY